MASFVNFLRGLNWGQSWLAIPGGVVLGVAILARHELWNGLVEFIRLAVTVFIDWVIDPLRRYFWNVVQFFERWVMRTLLYDPLSKLGLMKHTTFETFCLVIYASVAMLFLWLLWHRIPSLWGVFFARGRLRRSWVVALTLGSSVVLTGAAGTLYHNGYTRESVLVCTLSVVVLASFVHAMLTYPDTGDAADFAAAWPPADLGEKFRALGETLEDAVRRDDDAPRRGRTARAVTNRAGRK